MTAANHRELAIRRVPLGGGGWEMFEIEAVAIAALPQALDYRPVYLPRIVDTLSPAGRAQCSSDMYNRASVEIWDIGTKLRIVEGTCLPQGMTGLVLVDSEQNCIAYRAVDGCKDDGKVSRTGTYASYIRPIARIV